MKHACPKKERAQKESAGWKARRGGDTRAGQAGEKADPEQSRYQGNGLRVAPGDRAWAILLGSHSSRRIPLFSLHHGLWPGHRGYIR